MPEARYIRVFVDDQELDLPTETLPLSLNYKLEDADDFQKKKSSNALGLEFPATTNNDKIGNAFHDPASEDNSPDKSFSNFRKGLIEANGFELLVGKAFLKAATHNSRPLSYRWDFYGNNADWKVELEEVTLFEVLKHINFTFDKPTIEASWAFDGTSESLPYVFAPVRYRSPMDASDTDMAVDYLRPAISMFWPLFWGFKKTGYRIESELLNSEYFRRMVMPWTWGNFLYSEGTQLDQLDFLAKSVMDFTRSGISRTEYIDAFVSNDSTDGAFDNNNSYTYDVANKAMTWTYLPAFSFGTIEVGFYINIFLETEVNSNSDMHLWVRWFKNGTQVAETSLKNIAAPPGLLNKRSFFGAVEDWQLISVDPSDIITAKLYLRTYDSNIGRAKVKLSVDEFSIQYFKIPVGGRIDFSNYPAFKKYKWLDYLRGVIDLFNLEIQTDPINKIVLIEPEHPYSLTANQSERLPGYFNEDYIDWENKQDVDKVSELELFSEHERELLLNFKDDTNDGALKVISNRNQNEPGSSKFVLPGRFKAGKKAVTNRFFSPMVHYDVEQWAAIAGTAPQMPVLVPENISNTSRDEAQNTFSPKVAWYKGNVTGFGGWRFDGDELTSFPMMFSVNYKPGGEADPVLSYTDERIGTGPGSLRAVGLLRRFYLQRMAIMRNGQHYNTYFHLHNTDVSNWFHREHIKCRGQRWELIEINNYRPLEEETTSTKLRKWVPISQEDLNNCFPSASSIILDTSGNEFDIKYSPLKCLPSDIPN
jgi:hypothetical protein